ncbi:MAG: hypothetical protein LC733_08775, partial [Actinobacteria bacterium]|nr:hypothetical protein [Actinomycetota bacterium]
MGDTLPTLPWMAQGHAPYAPGWIARKASRFPRPARLAVAGTPAPAALRARRTWARSLRPPFHQWWGGGDE